MQHPDPTPPQPPTPVKKASPKKAAGRRKKGYVSPADDDPEEEPAEQAPQRRARKARYKPVQYAPEPVSEEEQVAVEPPRKRGRLAPVKTTTTRYGRTIKAAEPTAVISSTARATKRGNLSESSLQAPPIGGRSTRASRRSGIVGDQWEPIPEEWLQPTTAGKTASGKGRKGKKPVQEDEESELSELSDVAVGEESDLTSISSSTLSDVEGDEASADVARTPSSPREAGDSGDVVQNGEGLDGEIEMVEIADKTTEIGTNNGPPMDVDLTEPQPQLEPQALPNASSGTGAATSSSNIHISVDPNVANQDPPPVPSAAVEEQHASSVKEGVDIDMDAAPMEVVDQVVKNGETMDSAGVNGSEQAEAQVQHTASTAVGEELAPPKLSPTPQQAPIDNASIKHTAPEHQTNGNDGKTVLQEVSAEVAEALDEDEDDPKDEVRAIIKRARKPDYLEWELVRRHVRVSFYTGSNLL